jgi:hypothetical protein
MTTTTSNLAAHFLLTFSWVLTAVAQSLPIDTRPLTHGWLDEGKAEFNVYDATVTRYGHPREATITHIWVKEPWDANRGIKWDGEGQGDSEVVKLNQIISYQTGLYRYEQAWSGFWKRDSAELVKWSLSHHEGCGNTFKQARVADDKADYFHFSYFEGEGDGRHEIELPAGSVFYEELPLKLRLLAAHNLSDPVTIPLFPTVVHSKAGPMDPAPATIRQTRRSRGEVEFEVEHAGGTDRLVYETKIPFKLLRWEQADGNKLTLRKSLFTDYWNQTRPGDERLLE